MELKTMGRGPKPDAQGPKPAFTSSNNESTLIYGPIEPCSAAPAAVSWGAIAEACKIDYLSLPAIQV
jgi:hypothetical protein